MTDRNDRADGWNRCSDGPPEPGVYVIVLDNDFKDDLIADVDLWDGQGWHSNGLRAAAFMAGIKDSPEPQNKWTHWRLFPPLREDEE